MADCDKSIEVAERSFALLFKDSDGVVAIAKSSNDDDGDSDYYDGDESSTFAVTINKVDGEMHFEQRYYKSGRYHKRMKVTADIGDSISITAIEGIISSWDGDSETGDISTAVALDGEMITNLYANNASTSAAWGEHLIDNCETDDCSALTSITFTDTAGDSFSQFDQAVSVGRTWFTDYLLPKPLNFTSVTTAVDQ